MTTVKALVPGRAAEDAGRGDLAGARRHRRGLARRSDRLVARRWPRPWSRSRCRSASTTRTTTPTACAAPTRERRGPVRLTATGLASPARGAQRRDPLVRCRGGRRRGAVARREPVVVARRRRRDRRRGHLHRRARSRTATSGSGEVMVLVFFGFVATVGQRVRAARDAARRRVGRRARGRAPGVRRSCSRTTCATSTPIASPASARSRCASARRARAALYVVCIAGAIVAVVACGAFVPPALLAVLALPLAVAPVRAMLTRHDPPGLDRRARRNRPLPTGAGRAARGRPVGRLATCAARANDAMKPPSTAGCSSGSA